MNILFFHNNNITPTGGGISRITYNLSKVFSQKGHKVWFLSTEGFFTQEKQYNQLVLPNIQKVNCDENQEFLKRLCRENNIEVIINQSALMLSFCRLMASVPHVKKISVLHSSLFVPYRHAAFLIEYDLKKKGLGFILPLLKTELVNWLAVKMMVRKRREQYKSMVSLSDRVVVLTEGQTRDFALFLPSEEMKKIYAIPNCIELCEEDVATQPRKKQVLWVGTIDFKIKRIDLMIQIWKKVFPLHPDWTLKILGDSQFVDEAKRYAEKIGVEHVDFEGRVKPECYYKESEILCVTSTHEAFSMVLIEANKYGLVPMAFDSFPAAQEIIEDGISGVLIPPFQVGTYAEALNNLMDNENLRRRVQKASLESSKKFDANKIAAQWIDFLEKIPNQR